MAFVNRRQELERLEDWWRGARQGALGLVWGRRRVGKTELLQHFARGRRTVFHIAARRPAPDELRLLATEVAATVSDGFRDLGARPFVDWTDALETAAAAARDEPLLLVLDEFPELLEVTPELPSVLRAVWERVRPRTHLRLLLCGSALRTMEAMQEEREPLYGRIELSLMVHPFRPQEASQLLPDLPPADRALVWGIVGGVPQYLTWWDQQGTIAQNLETLVCTPGGRLLLEGDLIMATEGGRGDLSGQTLYAIGAGRTRFGEIKDAVRSDPTRTLERLRELRLIERILPVTEDEGASRRRLYRIADNFLAFWLSVAARYRTQIDLGLGKSILPVMMRELDDFMGPRWEEAFRIHLRRMAQEGRLSPEIVAIGPFWGPAGGDEGEHEIDAVALAGRERIAVLAGEAKWARRVDGRRLRWELERKVRSLPKARPDLQYAAAARDRVENSGDLLAITAQDLFP